MCGENLITFSTDSIEFSYTFKTNNGKIEGNTSLNDKSVVEVGESVFKENKAIFA